LSGQNYYFLSNCANILAKLLHFYANFGGRFCKKDQKWGKKEEDEDPG